MLETLVELGLTDDWQHMINSTAVRGHSQAAGAKGGLIRGGRSYGSFTSRIHARADGQGGPLGFVLTGGAASNSKAVDDLIPLPVAKPRLMLANKGYDSDDIRVSLLLKRILPVISTRANRKEAITCDFRAYKDRKRVERMFNKLKQFRRIATRYDKTAVTFLPSWHSLPQS